MNAEIISLFAKRLELTNEIARIKQKNALPIEDKAREKEQIQEIRMLAKKNQLSPLILEEMFHIFIDYSKFMMKLEMELTHG